MAEELIDKYLDREALKADTDFFVSQLNTLKSKYDEVKGSIGTLSFSTNSKEVVASAREAAAAYQQASKAQQDLTKSIIENEKAQQAKLKTEQEVIKTIQQEEKAEREQLKTKQAKATESEKSAKATKTEQKAVEDLGNDYKQLSLAYNEAALKAKNLALQQGSNTPAAKAALAEANALGDKLKEVDALTGQYTRNVGNYSSAFTGYALTLRGLRGPTKLLGEALGIGAMEADQFRLILEHSFQAIAAFFRGKEAKATAETADTAATAANTTANTANTAATEAGAVAQTEFAAATTTASASMTVFRGVLLASGIGIVIGLIALAYVRIKEFHQGIEDAGKAQKILNEALDSDSYATAVKNVIDLRENIKLAKEGFLDKKEVLNQYNETLGKTTGEVKSLDEAESILVKKGPAYLQMMLLQAAANLALEEASKKAVEAEKIHQKKREEFANALVDTRIATPGTFNAQEYDAETKRIAYAQAKRKAAAIQEKKDEAKESLNIFNKFRDDAAKLSKDSGLDLLGGKFDDKKKKDIKTIADAVAELRKELAAIQGKVDIGELAPKDADIDRVKAFDKAFEDIFKRGGTTSTPIVQQLAVELSPISQRVLEQQIKELTAKVNGKDKIDLLPPTEQLQKNFDSYKSFAEDEAKLFDEIAQRELVTLKTQSQNEQVELNERFTAGKISREDYHKEILRIQTDYSAKELQVQIEALNREIELLPAGTKAKEDAEKKLSDIRFNFQKVYEDRELASIQKLKDGYRELASSVIDAFGGIIENGYEKEKQALIDNQKLKDESYQKEIENIKNSSLSDQEKTARTIELQAQADAAKKLSDDKQKELDRKKARTEKIIQVAQIAGNATQSVFKLIADAAEAKAQAALLAANPLTAFYAPIALASAASIAALIPVTLGVAAAQIAKITIPGFKHGKFNGYEGLATVDDGGRPEPILRADGSLEYSNSSKPRVTYIGADDIVFPDMHSFTSTISTGQTDKVLTYSNSKSVDLTAKAINNQTRVLKSAFENSQRKAFIKVAYDPDFKVWVNKNVKGLG